MSLQDQINRADQAKRLLEDPAFKDAFAEVEGVIIDAWADLPVENKAQAEELKRLLASARRFRSIFEITIANGHVAKNELTADNLDIRRDAAIRKINGN